MICTPKVRPTFGMHIKIVYNGYDEMFLSGLSMGADGGIGSTYNFMEVGVLAGVKVVLRLTGIDVGVLRAPFAPLDKKQQEYVAKNIIPYLS